MTPGTRFHVNTGVAERAPQVRAAQPVDALAAPVPVMAALSPVTVVNSPLQVGSIVAGPNLTFCGAEKIPGTA